MILSPWYVLCDMQDEEKKTLWALKEIHDLHEQALAFVHKLVQLAVETGDKCYETLEELLEFVNIELEQIDAGLITVEQSPLRGYSEVLRMFKKKAAGGRFRAQTKIENMRKKLVPKGLISAAPPSGIPREVHGMPSNADVDMISADSGDDEDLQDVGADDASNARSFGNPFRKVIKHFIEKGPNSVDLPSMMPQFRAHIIREMEDDPRGVWVNQELDGDACEDCILVTLDANGNILAMAMKGESHAILLKHGTKHGLNHAAFFQSS